MTTVTDVSFVVSAASRDIDTTIIVPTFNEAGNVPALVERLGHAFRGRSAEVLFVDDSTDETPRIISRVAETSRIPVRLLHRSGTNKIGGLSGAVAAGIRASRSEFVLVMDGDLQHPPEMAPTLRDAAGQVDLSVASRYAGVGDASGLSGVYRRLVSQGSTLLAQACFPARVGRVCTDPMTGFFCFRRSAVDTGRLRPRGFKILLEILARHKLRVREVPFVFGERLAGESKAGWKNGVAFLGQLAGLRFGRASRFAAVGVLGTLVNLGVMAGLTSSLHYLWAAVAGAEVSILFNFVLQERFVFLDLRNEANSWPRRLTQQVLYNSAEALLRLPFLFALVHFLSLPSLLAQAGLLAAAFIARFLFVSRVVYRPRGRHAARPKWARAATPEFQNQPEVMA